MSKYVGKEIIKKNYGYITTEIEALELVDFLVENNAITSEDRQRIECNQSKIERNATLIKLILRDPTNNALEWFLKSLELDLNNKDILDRLQKSDSDNDAATGDDVWTLPEITAADRRIMHLDKVERLRALAEIEAASMKALHEQIVRLEESRRMTQGFGSMRHKSKTVKIDESRRKTPGNVIVSCGSIAVPMEESRRKTQESEVNQPGWKAVKIDESRRKTPGFGRMRHESKTVDKDDTLDEARNEIRILKAEREEQEDATEKLRQENKELKKYKLETDISVRIMQLKLEKLERREDKLKQEIDQAMNEIRILKAEREIDESLQNLQRLQLTPSARRSGGGLRRHDTSTEYIEFTVRANTHEAKFLPFSDFSINHLPACYQHDEMKNLIKSLADLTVKIEVEDVHEIREQFWKDKRHFFDEEPKSKSIILGSGKVEDVTLYSEKDGPCPCCCQKCKYVPKQKWGEIKILTSAQLLYDDKEAKKFVCTLFYDDETSHTITLIGENIVVKNIERDICIFTSVTCDLDLIACLERMLDKFEECWENAFDKYIHSVKWEDEKLIVLVSHPLGYKKHISIGKKLDCNLDIESKGINYDVPTLPGSRGAFLLVPDFDVIKKDVKVL